MVAFFGCCFIIFLDLRCFGFIHHILFVQNWHFWHIRRTSNINLFLLLSQPSIMTMSQFSVCMSHLLAIFSISDREILCYNCPRITTSQFSVSIHHILIFSRISLVECFCESEMSMSDDQGVSASAYTDKGEVWGGNPGHRWNSVTFSGVAQQSPRWPQLGVRSWFREHNYPGVMNDRDRTYCQYTQ